MTDWPDDWFRKGGSEAEPAKTGPASPGPAAPFGGQASAEPQTNPRVAAPQLGPSQGHTEAIGAGTGRPGSPPPGSAWPEQPALKTPGRPPWARLGGGASGVPEWGWRRWLRPRRIL